MRYIKVLKTLAIVVGGSLSALGVYFLYRSMFGGTPAIEADSRAVQGAWRSAVSGIANLFRRSRTDETVIAA